MVVLIGSAALLVFAFSVDRMKSGEDVVIAILVAMLLSLPLRLLVRIFTPWSVKFERYATKYPAIVPRPGVLIGTSPNEGFLRRIWGLFGMRVV